jgi:endo-1,4-beta-xylanase
VTITGTSGSTTASTTIALTVSPTGTTTGFACHIGYTISSQWAGGFGASVTINNTGTVSISNWTLTWTFANGQTITQLWSGSETQSGSAVTVTNVSYNGTIPAGGSYSGMGFNGSWNNITNAIPTSFAVNGTACE